MKNCSGKPGVVYDFNNQCLISYQDNFHNKGDLPFAIYFDFETTAPTDNCLDPEPKKNVCRFICYDCCVSSSSQIRAYYYLQKLCTSFRAINNFTQFFSRANKFY